ncbi:MAG: hypothetical protein IKK67_07810 [Bacteroidaceae bacterium]|nr:hypothetical protein [Bacteroidaceae bacterium]
MKRIKSLISITMMVMMCFMFAACPEPVPEPEDLLIGAWTDIDNEGTSYETKTVLTFSSNGKFEYNYYGGGSFGRTGKGYYSYNEKQEMLVLTYTSMDRTDLYIVQTLTSKSLVLLDPEDLYAWSFSKQKSGSNKEENGSEKEEANSTTGTLNGHEWVDLGLSVKWAICNVGASRAEDYGDYFAWGETTTKSDYSWDTYKWCKGTDDTMTKYCTDSDYGTVDNRTTLTSSDDVATVKWGSKWRMPTVEEIIELDEDCTWTRTTQSGVNGMKVTGPNGNSIFLPAAGSRDGTGLWYCGSCGNYWSATLDEGSSCAYYFDFDGDISGWTIGSRNGGFPVRPVTE